MKYLFLATLIVLATTAIVADQMPKPKELVPVAEIMLRNMKP